VIAGVRFVQQKNQPSEVGSEEQINPSESQGDAFPPWSVDGLCAAQRADPDIGFIIRLIESFAEQPSWESVSSESSDVKTLWKLRPRLRIQDGLLKRCFESIDGKSERWQVVLPKKTTFGFLNLCPRRHDRRTPRFEENDSKGPISRLLADVVIRHV